MKNIQYFIVFICLLSCIHTAEKHETEEHNENELISIDKSGFETMNIGLLKPKKEAMVTHLNATGRLDLPPYSLESVHAAMGGKVSNMQLLLGSEIKKGTIICYLENPSYIQLQQEYWQSKSNLKMLLAENERQINLLADAATASKNAEQANNALKMEEVKFAALSAQLQLLGIDLTKLPFGKIESKLPVIAPMSGTIVEIGINNGQWVQTSDLLVAIADRTHLHAELAIFEQDMHLVKKGQAVSIMLPNGQNFPAHIHLTGGKLDADKVLRVHAHFDNDPDNLIPGTYCDAKIAIDSDSSWALPASAVVLHKNKWYAYALVDSNQNNYRFKKIELNINLKEKPTLLPLETKYKTTIFATNAFVLLAKAENEEEEHDSH